MNLPTSENVRQAAEVLASIPGAIHRTPVLQSRILNELYGKQIFFKAENLQKIGAFKARGATHALARRPARERAHGVLTYSSGNHAQAVAHAARIFEIPARVFMPEDAPSAKVAGVRRYGAEIVFAGTTSDHRRQAAMESLDREGGVLIEPFDDPDVIAGQGTAGLELLEEVPDLDAVYVPVGGGGLCSGIQLAAQGMKVSPTVVGVEPEAACSLVRSLEAGAPTSIQPGPTIADGLRPVRVGKYPFSILKAAGTRAITVSDVELVSALRDLMTYLKVVVEPSGAAGLAGLRQGTELRVGVILSGGNVDLKFLGEILSRGD